MRHGDDEGIARGKHAMEILGRVYGIEKLGMTPTLRTSRATAITRMSNARPILAIHAPGRRRRGR